MKTCLVVRRGREYLVGVSQITGELNWSQYLYDAWRTRDRAAAGKVAGRVGGVVYLFNPIAADVRILGGKEDDD